MKKVITAVCYIICWISFAHAIETFNKYYKVVGDEYASAVNRSSSQTPYLDEWLNGMRQKEPIAEPIIRPVNTNNKVYRYKSTEPTFGKNVSVYTSNPRDPKTHGRKIRVEYPNGWEAKPGISPHNIYKFTDRQYGVTSYNGRTCIITINAIDEKLTKPEWQLFFLEPDTYKLLFSNPIKLLHSKVTQADTLPAIISLSEFTQEQIGIRLYSKNLGVTVGYQNTLIHLQCMAIAKDKESANKVFEESKNIFLSFMNSFKCLDMWENQEYEDDNEYSVKEKIISISNPDASSSDYQEIARLVSDNMTIGGICINSQQDVMHMQKNPNVVWAFATLSTYYTLTHWITDYCNTISIPYKSIADMKTFLKPYKETAEKNILNNMGQSYLNCLSDYLSISEYGRSLAYSVLENARLKAGFSKEQICVGIENQYVMSDAKKTLKKEFSKMGF